MRVSNRVVVTDVEGICESWASFYQDLFTACPVDLGVQSDLLDHLSLSLSPDEAALCDGPILPNETHEALLGMAKGKFPGSDGLTKEFCCFLGFAWRGSCQCFQYFPGDWPPAFLSA